MIDELEEHKSEVRLIVREIVGVGDIHLTIRRSFHVIQRPLPPLALAKLVTYTIANNRVSLDPVDPYLCSLSWQHHAS